jgi:hypothetical protein
MPHGQWKTWTKSLQETKGYEDLTFDDLSALFGQHKEQMKCLAKKNNFSELGKFIREKRGEILAQQLVIGG